MRKDHILRKTALFLCLFTLFFIISSCKRVELPELPSETSEAENIGAVAFSYEEIPPYLIYPYTVVNGGRPFFDPDDIPEPGIYLSDLDSLGRAGQAMCVIGREDMPKEERGEIGMVKPSGWRISRYDFIDGTYLYNRCHLLGYQLTGLNAEEENLITGTRYMNVHGMLPFENDIAYYLRYSDMHVCYRVTPVYVKDEPVARGVLMEAMSVEDKGKSLLLCVFCYNVQPGVSIEYGDGSNEERETSYELHMTDKEYHQKNCKKIISVPDEQKQLFSGDTDMLRENGFAPCRDCIPEG